jgi:antirestriction protein ArdC
VQRPGIDDYAFEELVAEIGAAFLCAHSGLAGIVEHASYIETWLSALRNDKRLIFVAAGAAQKAADFVLGFAEPIAHLFADEVAA